jgi:hypothetical protein
MEARDREDLVQVLCVPGVELLVGDGVARGAEDDLQVAGHPRIV